MPTILNQLNDVAVDENQGVEFTAKVNAEPLPQIEWSHDGTIIKNGVNYKVNLTKKKIIIYNGFRKKIIIFKDSN